MSINDRIAEEIDDRNAVISRARVPLDENAARAKAIADAQTMAREAQEATLPRRMVGDRVAFGQAEQTLAHEPIPDFRLYWFNDTPGRVVRAIRAGYTHVLTDDGQPLQRCVDTRGGGGGINAYLMKIPLVWYYEDMAAAQKERDQRLADIKEGRFGANPGQNQYVPKTGIIVADQRR
jgi:hypothetical protein